MAIGTLKIWGNNLDLPNAKKWCAYYLTGYYNFIYTETTNMTRAQEKAAVVSSSDILLGGVGAPNGVGKYFSVPAGTIRLYGTRIRDTDKAIEEWARRLREKLDAEAKATKPSAPPAPPRIPTAPESFNSPMPSFSDDVETVNKYSYFFGIDTLLVKSKDIVQDSCFISEDIEIGELAEGEYIQLHAEYESGDHSSIEFYILGSGDAEPIMPDTDSSIENEKICYGLRPRFSIEEGTSVVIKKDGMETSQTLEEAMAMTDGTYTISYTPVDSHSCSPVVPSIKIKVIMRLYDKSMPAPHVNRMEIRKYGGSALWKESI